MSRRSLRLPNSERYGAEGFLDRSSPQPYSSTPQCLGKGGSGGGHRVLKSRRSQQLSCSQSLLAPTPPPASHRQHYASQSLHSAASDASLMSSMLEESGLEEKTVLDTFWGLEQDGDPTESTILAAPSANSTVLSTTDILCPKHPNQTQTSIINGHHYCSDCVVIRSDRREVLTTTTAADRFSASRNAGRLADADPVLGSGQASRPMTNIYGRDKNRKNRKGGLVSMGRAGLGAIKRWWAGCVSGLLKILALLYTNVLLKIRRDGAGVMWSLWESQLQYGSRAATSVVWLLALVSQECHGLAQRCSQAAQHACKQRINTPQARSCSGQMLDGDTDSTELSQYCGVVNVEGMGTNGKQLDCNGSLCDDCKEKHHTVTSSSPAPPAPSRSSSYLLGLLWSATLYTGTCVSRLARAAGSTSWTLTKNLLSAVWSTGQSSGKAWHHLVTMTAFLKNILTTRRSLSKLLSLCLVFIPLLLCGLWWLLCSPDALLSVLPVVNVTQLGTALSSSSLTSMWSSSSPDGEITSDVQASAQTPPLPPPTTPHSQAGNGDGASAMPGADSEQRLQRLEQSVSQLWRQAEAGGQHVEQRHGDLLALFSELQRQVQAHSRQALEPWVSGLLEHRLDRLRRQLEEEGLSRQQTQQQYVLQQQKQASHLAELELLIKSLTVKTEEFQRRQEESVATTRAPSPSTLPVPASVGVDRDSHNALLAEVDGLKSTLEDVRQDLQGLMGVQERCEQQEDIQATISARVKAQVLEELRVLFYGNQLTPAMGREEATTEDLDHQSQALPRDSLLQWLAERYVTPDDLRAGMNTLELSILDTVSQKLEETQQKMQVMSRDREAQPETQGRESELLRASVTEEEVRLMVKDALRLYSEDRTSMPDFALESGGGSILSTRCSQTLETKTALLSLFGIPLWYFTQSPRVVIQPDIQPGNCWAFKGSQGYLVIRLSMSIIPTAFSLEHIPKALAPGGRLHSAPKDFTVHGLDDEDQVNGTFLGRYTYEEDGEALQTFTVTEQNQRSFQIVEVQVLSNWGHQEYTCMYRFRVHGKPSNN